ncbi:prepilin-type N-terminal cleavage/methylation domain-containing protein [Candidatus Electrothrix aarhusensis]|uniref:Type II secretion system protein H n=1 Tax=Candidatus Electrothrix aarhusensis TaxID=1859131 RepID=A0A444IWM9_9BACT|nr:prepilin-type N-terminal cleavage/methylation domain-containing protein [Candidatus Electrothrix aarhusensis]
MLLKDSLSGCLFGKQSERGLSLVELMTTLAIFGALSAIAVPGHFTTRPRRRLKAATREQYGALQQARLMAVSNRLPVRVCFDENSRSYSWDTFDVGNADANKKVCDSSEKTFDLKKYEDIAFGCTGAKKNWNSDPISQASYITFSPTGTANSRTVYLQNIEDPSECFAVTSQVSGALKVRWFDGKKWKK